eukprot:jgi/Botrbrau1/20035/Bobra.200_1s0040.1
MTDQATPEAMAEKLDQTTLDSSEKSGGTDDQKINQKELKAAKKAERAAQRGQAAAILTQPEEGDPLGEHYGDPPLIQSQSRSTSELAFHTSRGKGKSCFIILRQRDATIQAALFVDGQDRQQGHGQIWPLKYPRVLWWMSGTVVGTQGSLSLAVPNRLVEIQVTEVHCISRAGIVPFEVIDASRTADQLRDEDSQFVTVAVDTRLDKRYIDLRTPFSQAVFKIQSGVCQLFRELLLSEGFQEIHTPKLLGGASEGGASVFRFDYMGRPRLPGPVPPVLQADGFVRRLRPRLRDRAPSSERRSRSPTDT